MIVVSGDPNRLAFECEILPEDEEYDVPEALFRIAVSGERYGSYRGGTAIPGFFEGMKCSLQAKPDPFPEIFHLDGALVLESIRAVFSDDTKEEDCPLEKHVPGFFDSAEDYLDRIVYYSGQFAFDDITILMISKGDETKLIVSDRLDGRMSSVVVGSTEFSDLICEFEERVFALAPIAFDGSL